VIGPQFESGAGVGLLLDQVQVAAHEGLYQEVQFASDGFVLTQHGWCNRNQGDCCTDEKL
jgi:hypothetical protein